MIRFDDRTVERGVRYYLDGRVGYLRADGRQIVALVAGTRPNPYSVFLNADTPEQSRCTCPVGYACKHLAATVVAVLDGGLKGARVAEALQAGVNADALYDALHAIDRCQHSPPGSPFARPGAQGDLGAGAEDQAGECIVELAGAVDDARPAGYDRPVRSGVRTVDDESATSWRVAVAVGVGYDRVPTAHLVRQYRRRDGAYGRLDRLSPDEPVYLPDAAAAGLVERLDALGGSAPVAAFAEELCAVGLPCFAGTIDRLSGAQERPMEFVMPARIELAVDPVPARRNALGNTLGRPGAEIQLALTVHVETARGRRSIRPGSEGDVGSGTRTSVMLVPEARLALVADARMRLVELARFLRYEGTVSIDDIASIGRLVEGSPDLLALRFPRRVRVVTVDAEPCFILERDGDSILIALEAGGLPEDGYVGDEYRVHRATATISPGAMEAGIQITGTAPVRLPMDEGWIWQVDCGDASPDLTSIALALTGRGFTVYVEDPARGRRRVRRTGPLTVTISSGTDWFAPAVRDAHGVELDYARLELMACAGRYADGDELVLLDASDTERIRMVLDAVGGSARGRSSRADLATLVDLADVADEVAPDLEAVLSLARSVLSGDRVADRTAPPGLEATLRPYQLDGYAWLATLARHRLSGCLADDMGLGKTVQALALMLLLRDLPAEEPSEPERASGGCLVVAPVSTLANWEHEAARFAPELRVRVHHGAGRCRTVRELAREDLVVTSYATATRDVELLQALEWRLLVLDEAQFIKNPHARTTRRLKGLPSALRLCLTGTPVENVTTDLWSIMDFLVPGLLGSLASFSRRFPKRNVTESESDARKLDRLRRIVSPFLLRRTKEAVAPELPPRVETILRCEMGTKQARFYETLRHHHHGRVQEAIRLGDRTEIGAAILTGLLRLRQAALYPEDADRTGEGVPSTKEAELLDQLEEVTAEGLRTLVFSQFVSALTRMRDAAVRRGMETLYLDGRTRNRASLIRRFQGSDSPLVFFISLRAGGTGINLTAADHVFICDPWWNPQVERQAVDRAHRIGRTRAVMVTRLVTATTVEEKVLALQDQKRRLANDLVAENAGGISMDDAEELLSLFERAAGD